MDFDDAKENIQPLAQGRNASILHASLRVESPQELLAQRKILEKEIHDYTGDDPLSVWYNYIEWIEQSFPSGGKESGLQEVLSKCLAQFESDEKYNQDRRMIKLYIKFIDSYKDPAECYQQLFNAGIGTMVADFYIAWAYCYDLIGNTRKADEIFLRGISCRAQPLEDLQEARQHFGFSVAQRLMYKDDDPIREETNRQLHERRVALTSLRAHRRKHVSSIRTGFAVKSISPGKVKVDLPSTSTQRGNPRVEVLKDEIENQIVASTPLLDSASTNETGKSVVRSIIDAARDQENQKEPGPWHKANSRRKGKLFGSLKTSSELGFEIHEDRTEDDSENPRKPCIPPISIAANEIKFDKPFIYPPKFSSASKPIKGWITPVTTEEKPDANTLPEYNKCKLYPRPNVEFQPEELKAYNILQKRGITNNFTKERVVYWGSGPQYNIRLYPHFATKSKEQATDAMDDFFMPEKLPGLQVAYEEIYKKDGEIERQFEEILASRIKRNETIIETADMEETMCLPSEKIHRRKSFFPMRKSIPPTSLKTSNRTSIMPQQSESLDDLATNAATASNNARAVEEECESRTDAIFKSRKVETTEKSTVETMPPSVASRIFLTHDESSKLLMQKESVIESQSRVATEKVVSKEVLPIPFEIFKDESATEVKTDKYMEEENDFQFKTPALPIPSSTSAVAVPRKLPFEIFEEENLHQNSPDFGCGTGGFFDAEETCSTHTFNIFLQAQSVSTPKVTVKSKPQRQFGNVLKDVPPPPEPKEDVTDNQSSNIVEQNCAAENQNTLPAAASTAITYSPIRERLSTILETSEHGTSQGTHTTGTTTKSTFSSPEFELESQVRTPANVCSNQPHTVLETVEELSCEIPVDIVMEGLKIQPTDDNTSKTRASANRIETPVALRLQNKYPTGGLEKSACNLSIKKDEQQVGNFSRLEEKEDTAAGLIFKTLPTIRFQDDKTETIPQILLSIQQSKFQDEKTETISKMILETPSKYQQDKTENISKILAEAPPPVKYPEDKTETITKFMLAAAHLERSEANKLEFKNLETEKNMQKNIDQHDSFEFFVQTPPKASKQLLNKQVERCTRSQVRTAADSRTPLIFDSKRFCGRATPATQKPIALFEDELQEDLKNKCTANIKDNMKDSFLSDFVFNEENQHALLQNKARGTSRSVLRDSFVPDFSFIADSQPPQIKQIQSTSQLKVPADESILPEFSFTKDTQPKPSKPELSKSCNKSLSDFLIIPETQPMESTAAKPSQSTEAAHFQQSFLPPSTVSKNDAENNLERNNTDNSCNRKQSSNPNNTSQNTQLKNILMDTFMKGFSEINEPHRMTSDVKQISVVNQFKNKSSLRFLDESLKQRAENSKNNSKSGNISTICADKDTKLKFRMPESTEEKFCRQDKKPPGSDIDQFFELNCETEMFGTNISMIKNSTWLPNHGPSAPKNAPYQAEQIHQKSLHLKCEEPSSASVTPAETSTRDLRPECSLAKPKFCIEEKADLVKDLSIEMTPSEMAVINAKSIQRHTDNTIVIPESPEVDDKDNNDMSIYYKHTPKSPKPHLHIWDDSDALKTGAPNQYVHVEADLNHTQLIIENVSIDPNVNPFNVDLINAFLEQHYVISYLESLPTCKLVGCIQRLRPNVKIDINGVSFSVLKLIGEGAYGAVFCGKDTRTGKLVAMKQEKPPNFWEYYICLEIRERIRCDEMLYAYMSVDYALIGNNSSILISKYSNYGSLITVCNKIKKQTMKNVDEYVVMLLASELLEIMDHLHAVNIIHADVKADNFLLMNKLSYPPVERHLQLIDFGVSIDMKLFKVGQTFSFVHNENPFNCPEMREGRPWTYQLDLYGLAGVIHVLLFGKYMDIERKERGFWMHKTRIPRYINKTLWDEIFKALLNIRDCKSMPNLQDLRALLKKELEEKQKYVLKMVNEFNRALLA